MMYMGNINTLLNLSDAVRSPLDLRSRCLVVDVLFGYCAALRRHNGDWSVDAQGAATELVSG